MCVFLSIRTHLILNCRVQLRQHAWERLVLQDHTMLPLGVSVLDTQ